MGNIIQDLMSDLEIKECPKCKSKKFRLLKTIYLNAYAYMNKNSFLDFSEEGDELGDSNVSIFCDKCNELIKECG